MFRSSFALDAAGCAAVFTIVLYGLGVFQTWGAALGALGLWLAGLLLATRGRVFLAAKNSAE